MLLLSFKPYYNWNTFNTKQALVLASTCTVLNLIITGIPSIHNDSEAKDLYNREF